MNSHRLRAIFLLIFLFGQLPALSQPLKALGYLGWWTPQSWQITPIDELDRLFFFELNVDANGEVSDRHGWPDQWEELQAAVQQRHVPMDLALTLFDVDTFNRLFSSEKAVNTLLAESLNLVKTPAVSGLHFDFEIYSGATLDAIRNYRSFLAKLSGQLNRFSPSRDLSVFLPVQADEALYDARTLSLMSLVVVQSYDSHYRSSKNAGPVSPLDGQDALTWKTAAAEALALGISRDKLFLTFPLYGYEWIVLDSKLRSPTQKSGITTSFSDINNGTPSDIQTNITDRVQQYGAFHDPASGSSYYKFKNEQGQWVEGWFEDWWSLGRKIDFLNKEKLAGTAFFLLGYDQGELLQYYLERKVPKSLDALINQLEFHKRTSP
jgi:spore germination protein YaaH